MTGLEHGNQIRARSPLRHMHAGRLPRIPLPANRALDLRREIGSKPEKRSTVPGNRPDLPPD